MPKIILLYVTCANNTEAKEIAKTLIQERLIACANIVNNVTSIYKYKNKLCEEEEVIMIAKTISGHFQKVKDRITEIHSYDIPCIIECNTSNFSSEFANWVSTSVLDIEN